jgi:hypothetical protein
LIIGWRGERRREFSISWMVRVPTYLQLEAELGNDLWVETKHLPNSLKAGDGHPNP